MIEAFQEILTTDPVHADVMNTKIVAPGNKLVDFVTRHPYSGDIIGIQWDSSSKDPRLQWIDGTGRYLPYLPPDYFDKHSIFDRRRCVYIREDGHIEVGADGAGSDIIGLDGKPSYGSFTDDEYDILVRKPKFYVKFEYSAPYYRWWVASEQHAGFDVWPLFRQRYDDIQSLTPGDPAPAADYWFDGAFEAYGYVDDGKFKLGSQTDRKPVTGNSGTDAGHVDWDPYPGLVDANVPDITLTKDGEFTISIAEKCAGLVGDGFGITNFWNYCGDQLLMYIEYATFDIQTVLGKGIVDLASGNKFAGKYTGADNINGRLAANGTGVGSGVDGKTPVAWRGIENPYSNVWKFIIGANFDQSGAKYRLIKRDGTGALAIPLGAGTYEEGTGVPLNDAYVSRIMTSELGGLAIMPSQAAGSDSTYLCDYWWYPRGANYILLAGGYWFAGRYAGPGDRYASDAVSRSSRVVGARVEFRPPKEA